MSLKLQALVIQFLKQYPEQKFTARAIAGWIFEKYPDKVDPKVNTTK